jgi:hypothetical protein
LCVAAERNSNSPSASVVSKLRGNHQRSEPRRKQGNKPIGQVLSVVLKTAEPTTGIVAARLCGRRESSGHNNDSLVTNGSVPCGWGDKVSPPLVDDSTIDL